ncbi:diguanylate cyclase/phosphodiesterase with PAS/PAC sensor(s) [Caballeronia choica]|uniref:Diguanylate cyclase/phosphodiesterase with PAS/PAC sensor(S) n=1 Tax=Caballeronia choica TaxID=326476 RepID=A0A158KXT2_9BURK|nr:diguanylate cyclase/phosphodiesterase with PAS/PAC sensor(s) [Caballeronia choica]
MVEAMVALARALGMGTVAEGIETETQLGLVKELGCDVVQGHFIGRPAPAARIEPFAETRFGPAPAASSSSQDARSGPRWRSTRSRPVRLASAASDELESTPRALKRAKSQHLIPPGDALHPGRVNQAFSGDDASIRSSLSVSRACGYTRSLRLPTSLGPHGPQANPVFHRPLRGRLRHARGQAPQYRAARAQHADFEARSRTATDALRTRPARHDADRGGAPHVSPLHADHARHRPRARAIEPARRDHHGSRFARNGGVGSGKRLTGVTREV